MNEINQGEKGHNRDNHKEGEFAPEHGEGRASIHGQGEVEPIGNHCHHVPGAVGVLLQTANIKGPVFRVEVSEQGYDADNNEDDPMFV